MKNIVVILLSLMIIFTGYSCKPKKCATFSDTDKDYKNNYNKKGLVKKKNKAPKRDWGQY